MRPSTALPPPAAVSFQFYDKWWLKWWLFHKVPKLLRTERYLWSWWSCKDIKKQIFTVTVVLNYLITSKYSLSWMIQYQSYSSSGYTYPILKLTLGCSTNQRDESISLPKKWSALSLQVISKGDGGQITSHFNFMTCFSNQDRIISIRNFLRLHLQGKLRRQLYRCYLQLNKLANY